MAKFKKKLKNLLINSRVVPAVYTFLSRPFSRSLRHLNGVSPELPANFKKITAIIPNYNYAEYLEARIDSILSQSYPVSELIILDDASTDGSESIIEKKLTEIKTSYPNLKVKYIKNKKNSGKSIYQWQKAFSLASGDFVWIAEADDSSDKDFLRFIMPAFDDKDVVLSYTNSVAINGSGQILSYDFAKSSDKYHFGHWNNSYIEDGKKERELYLNKRCSIPNVSAVVFRNDQKIPYVKYLEEAKRFAQVGDWYLYLKVLSHGKISFTRASLNFFRVHSGSVTGKSKKNTVHIEEINWIHNHIDMI